MIDTSGTFRIRFYGNTYTGRILSLGKKRAWVSFKTRKDSKIRSVKIVHSRQEQDQLLAGSVLVEQQD